MSNLKDMIGKKFGRLMVLSQAISDKHGFSRWLCQCNCGKKKIILGISMRKGNTKSCGCLASEILSQRLTTHGLSNSAIYHVWEHLIQRCTNPKDKNYKNYGGRGITVCEQWKKFENFLKDMGKPPTKQHSIDRIDNDGNYCESNCRWATYKEQNRNNRHNNNITFDNRTMCITDWAKENKIHKDTLWHRIHTLGWSVEKSLTKSVSKTGRRIK